MLDPWVASHLHLARDRGSLTAPNSPVQDFALRLLRLVDAKRQGEQRVDNLKFALLGAVADDNRLHAMFPEYFTKEWLASRAIEAARDKDGKINIDLLDDKQVEWGVASQEEDEEMSRWIAERERGQVSMADLGDGWI